MMSPEVEAIAPIEDDDPLWVAKYKRALLFIEDKIPGNVRKILIAHHGAPDRRLSVLEMGKIAGYRGTRAASLQYGLFAGKLSESMGIDSPGYDKISTIGAWDSTSDERGHGGWLMYNELAAALEELGWASSENSFQEDQDVSLNGLITSRISETTLRVGQDIFRDRLLDYWGGCAVTGCDVSQILIASHIVPWSEASDLERLDVYNGLPLTPNLDRLFDQYFISFDENGLLHTASSLSKASLATLGIVPGMKLRKMVPEHVPYLTKHFRRFQELQLC